MPLTEYTYTATVNQRVLSDEIDADATITPKTCDHIISLGTDLRVWMSDTLTAPKLIIG